MKNILTIFALLLFAGCSNSRDAFVGTWAVCDTLFTPEGYEDAYYKYELRLDFAHPGSVKCDILDQPADGVLYAYEDMGVCVGESYEPITLDEVAGDTAFVEYIHDETGERWSAKLALNPADKSLTFIKGKMLERGPGSLDENDTTVYESDFEGQVSYFEPDSAVLKFIDANPATTTVGNDAADGDDGSDAGETAEKEAEAAGETGSNTEVELADRTIYVAVDEAGSPQLFCRFKSGGAPLSLTDGDGESLIGIGFVEDIWKCSDGKSALYILCERGTEFMTLSLMKITADNRVETIDSTMGITPDNPIVGAENITDDMIPKIYTGCDEVTVYEPKGEAPARTAVYDLDGNKIR